MISQDPETTTEFKNALHKSNLSVYLSQCNSLLVSHILPYPSTAFLSTCSSTHDTKPKNTKKNSFSSSPQPLVILEASLLALHQNALLFSIYLPIFFISSADLHISHQKLATSRPQAPPLINFLLSFNHKLPFSLTQPPPSLPLQLINAAPLLSSIRAASFLYNISHKPRERPPHALPCSSNGETAAEKKTANKANLNP
jgi:hypothetical protein